jgi:Putative restriction endonuclease
VPIPLPEVAGPNELLGHLLLNYQENHSQGSALDDTLPQQYVRTPVRLRLADRLIWTGLGRLADPRRDRASIAVEFVAARGPSSKLYYVDKRKEYMAAGIREYWIIDRFRRTLTVIQKRRGKVREQVIREDRAYESPLLPGFKVPLARLLESANQRAKLR